MDKSVITVVGKNSVGIIARISAVLAEDNIGILEISQTINDGIFNMMMIVDSAESRVSFDELCQHLQSAASELGVIVLCQKEEIFYKMQRI